jgi:hypothetical protein
MSEEEVGVLLEAQYEDYQDRWNQVRFISYVQAQTAGAKFNTAQDLVRFPWDEEEQKLTSEQLVQTQYDLISAFNNPNKTEYKPVQ